jgi:hypothetical protein
MLTAVGAASLPAGKSSHKGSKGSPPYSDDEGSDHTSDVEDAEDYRKGELHTGRQIILLLVRVQRCNC